MTQFLTFLAGIIKTIVSWYQQPAIPTQPVVPAPTTTNPKPAPDNHATLVAWMNSQEIDLGPMPITGGVIHKDSAAMTDEVASLIIANCSKVTLGLPTVAERIALMASWIRAESDFDPLALDPNDENLPKNPTAEQILDNLDLGIAQFSWRTLVAMPDFKGMTVDEIKTQATDPEWAIAAMFEFCDALIVNAKAAFIADPGLKAEVPNADPLYLGVEDYNLGGSGGVAMARNDGLKGNWAYANSVMANFEKLKPLFL